MIIILEEKNYGKQASWLIEINVLKMCDFIVVWELCRAIVVDLSWKSQFSKSTNSIKSRASGYFISPKVAWSGARAPVFAQPVFIYFTVL